MIIPVTKAILGADGNTLSVTGLDGGRDGIYVCLARIVYATGPGVSAEIEIHPNGVATGDSQRHQGGVTANLIGDMSPAAIGEGSGSPTESSDWYFTIDSFGSSGDRMLGVSMGMKRDAAAAEDAFQVGFGDATASNLTSFDLFTASGTFAALKTKCYVWRLGLF